MQHEYPEAMWSKETQWTALYGLSGSRCSTVPDAWRHDPAWSCPAADDPRALLQEPAGTYGRTLSGGCTRYRVAGDARGHRTTGCSPVRGPRSCGHWGEWCGMAVCSVGLCRSAESPCEWRCRQDGRSIDAARAGDRTWLDGLCRLGGCAIVARPATAACRVRAQASCGDAADIDRRKGHAACRCYRGDYS